MRANAPTPPTTPPAILPAYGVLCLAGDVGVVVEVLVVEEVVVTEGAVVDEYDEADVEVDSIDYLCQIKILSQGEEREEIKGSKCMHTR